jgi:hypothetical protein
VAGSHRRLLAQGACSEQFLAAERSAYTFDTATGDVWDVRENRGGSYVKYCHARSGVRRPREIKGPPQVEGEGPVLPRVLQRSIRKLQWLRRDLPLNFKLVPPAAPINKYDRKEPSSY